MGSLVHQHISQSHVYHTSTDQNGIAIKGYCIPHVRKINSRATRSNVQDSIWHTPHCYIAYYLQALLSARPCSQYEHVNT